MKRIIITAIIAIFTLATSPTYQSSRVTEDSPFWDCKTMGNHICGPVTSYREDVANNTWDRDKIY